MLGFWGWGLCWGFLLLLFGCMPRLMDAAVFSGPGVDILGPAQELQATIFELDRITYEQARFARLAEEGYSDACIVLGMEVGGHGNVWEWAQEFLVSGLEGVEMESRHPLAELKLLEIARVVSDRGVEFMSEANRLLGEARFQERELFRAVAEAAGEDFGSLRFRSSLPRGDIGWSSSPVRFSKVLGAVCDRLRPFEKRVPALSAGFLSAKVKELKKAAMIASQKRQAAARGRGKKRGKGRGKARSVSRGRVPARAG